jgi:hypothetical protein
MPAAAPPRSLADAEVALELQLLRGQLQASGLRPGLKASAERRLALAIAHLRSRAAAEEIGPQPSAATVSRAFEPPEEIGAYAPEADGARLPHWVGN